MEPTTSSIDLSQVVLLSGSHPTREKGMCVMEAVAFVAGLPHSDRPACACPALSAFARTLNDRWWPSDEARTEVMRPLIPMLVGSKASHETCLRRGYFFADRAVRELVPATVESLATYREKLGRHDLAAMLRGIALKLRAVPEIVDRCSRHRALASDATATWWECMPSARSFAACEGMRRGSSEVDQRARARRAARASAEQAKAATGPGGAR